MDEEFKNTLEVTERHAQYDACAKKILSNKNILAHIIKETIPEYKDMQPSEIIPYIEGEPLVGKVRVEPGLTNPTITGVSTEDYVPTEEKIIFDILFFLREVTGVSKVIVNIEAQQKENPGYPLVNRAIYYGCRSISSQKGREFRKSNYGDIKKVYSIWLCFNMREDCMNVLHMENTPVIGNHDWKGDAQLMNIVLIGIQKETKNTDYTNLERRLHDLLKIVFSSTLSWVERLDLLEERMDVIPDTNFRKELKHMCNLSYGIKEEGIELERMRSIQKLLLKNFSKEEVKNLLEVTDEEVDAAEEMLCVK